MPRHQSSDHDQAMDDKSDKTDSGSAVPSSPGIDTQVDVEKGAGQGSVQPTSSQATDDAFIVRWDDNDPANPKNWSSPYKAFLTFVMGSLAFSCSLGSSIISPAEDAIAREFGISRLAAVLCIALYVLGFACGPCLWAPVAEAYGRKISMIPAVLVLALFSIGSATSQSPASLFVTRFFCGVFGSAAVSNVAPALGDIYEARIRGVVEGVYAICTCGGITIGPVIGAALVVNPHLGWRWTQYIQAIWTAASAVFAYFAMPEIYEAVLLKRKAQRVRKETGDDRYWHPQEYYKIKPRNIITKHLVRPLEMMATEPMVTCITLYASFVYSLLYMTLEIFPIVYIERRGWGLVLASLPFLGLLIGIVGAWGITIANQPFYLRAIDANHGKPAPEARMPPMVIGGWLFVIGLFWFGWTAAPPIHWAAPTVATLFIGAGFGTIFQQCINTLIDTYGPYAASAVAATTIFRSFLSCAMPLAVPRMFQTLGLGPGTSVLGAIAALALPVPWIFQRKGYRLRKKSKFAPVDDS